jgi:C1A family cysteine protease
MGSRWRIHINATEKIHNDIDFSVQHLVNCDHGFDPVFNHTSKGCNGGSSYSAFAYAHANGTVDSSCLPYEAINMKCDSKGICQQHLKADDDDAFSPKHKQAATPTRYYAAEYGAVNGEVAMQKEVFARGPISCCMACPDEFEAYKGGIFVANTNRTICDHIVTVVGFGGEADQAYWQVQNSFGSVWGEQGFFRIKRTSALNLDLGEHNLGIEQYCAWMMPKA